MSGRAVRRTRALLPLSLSLTSRALGLALIPAGS